MKDRMYIFEISFIVFVLGLLPACSKTNHNDDHGDLPEIKIVKVADHVSRMGSAYIDCNKIVRLGDYFYFVYLSANYEVVIQGIDQKNEMLTEPCVIGTATDNHGSPCITTDVDGYIYVMYDGHCDEVKLVRSENPGDISDWVAETSIAIEGRTLTYPVMNIYKDKIFVLLRSSPYGGDEGALLTLCTKSINSESWTCIDLFKGNHDKWRANKDFKIWVNGYNRFYANMIIHNDRVHISFQCLEYLPQSIQDKLVISAYCLGYLCSDDMGATWKTSGGKIVEQLPAIPEDIDLIAGSGEAILTPGYQAINLVIYNNVPVFCYAAKYDLYTDLFIARLMNGVWIKDKINYQDEAVGKLGESECSFSIDNKGNRQLLIPMVDEKDFNNKVYGGNSTILKCLLLNEMNEQIVDSTWNDLMPSWLPNFGKADSAQNTFLFTKGNNILQDGNCELYFGIIR